MIEEVVSPAGRFFLLPETDQVINCIIGFENPIDVESIKTELQRTLLRFHPRLSCLLVRDSKGREHWRAAQKVNIDDHVILSTTSTTVNDYAADLTFSSPLSPHKPLWEIHLLLPHRAAVLRLHHSLGDGVALMALFLACCQRADDPSLPLTIPGDARRRRPNPAAAISSPSFLVGLLFKALKMLFFTLLFVLDLLLHAAWKKDEGSPIEGGAGVELWPRKLCTVSFDLEEIKAVKRKIDGTVNDVLVGIIASGLAKYFKKKSSKESTKDLRVTGLSMVNTREIPGLQDFFRKIKEGTSEWGNRFGYVLLPIWLDKNGHDPLEYIHQAKGILSLKKQSLEALFSYKAGALIMSIFGLKVAAIINYRIMCNTSFTLSNVVGPSEKVMYAKNPITYLRVTSSGLPHALIIHMISYNGKADLQLLVAKDIIHDPETLAKCFEDAFREMKLSSITKI